MKSLYIMGTPGSGKTVVALGLAQKLQQEGYKVGYFKPVAEGRKISGSADMDAVLMKEVLGLKAPLEKIAPVPASPFYLSAQSALKDAQTRIMDAYEEISNDTDVVLIDGALSIDILSSHGLDCISLARKTGAFALLVLKVENDYSLDNAIFLNRHLLLEGVPVIGTIFSNVPRPLYAKTDGVYRPILEQAGCKTLGVFPTRPEIAAPTVGEYYNVLGGEILTGHDRLNLLVEDVIIGAMTMASALTYLRRAANKAVILGGDRADLALAALETSTSVLILTGGLYPDVKVIARAEEMKVPVILVHYDTYTTIEKLGQVSRHIQPSDRESIRAALENIVDYCDWKYILSKLNKL
ncbi:MAG: phosphotransacetylase family protein [Pelotomaculum sp.]|uniref:BioD-like N-terminal domain of phosphotransacetylase n=1 Tax=Pelotomaculum thermopropionicum (strain DSM 13744 / JCM 10971 / SI) TaxID=370438 RepID=A5D253_PELTS|nr:phosphotransacetylase family protein [Pelotomaculum sp.]BAF59689.1 BioD-like N-terminal domain of phosphotransacetylase [Pelotomaculum thermopropionicum SI]